MSISFVTLGARPVIYAATKAELRTQPSTSLVVAQQAIVGPAANIGRYQYDPASLVADDNVWWLKPDDLGGGDPGRWIRMTAFGLDYQWTSVPGIFASTSGVYAAVPGSLLTTPVMYGSYRVRWSAKLSTSANATDVEARLYNVTDAVQLGSSVYFDNVFNTERASAEGSAIVSFTGAAKAFQVEWRRPAGVFNANIEDVWVEVWKAS